MATEAGGVATRVRNFATNVGRAFWLAAGLLPGVLVRLQIAGRKPGGKAEALPHMAALKLRLG